MFCILFYLGFTKRSYFLGSYVNFAISGCWGLVLYLLHFCTEREEMDFARRFCRRLKGLLVASICLYEQDYIKKNCFSVHMGTWQLNRQSWKMGTNSLKLWEDLNTCLTGQVYFLYNQNNKFVRKRKTAIHPSTTSIWLVSDNKNLTTPALK